VADPFRPAGSIQLAERGTRLAGALLDGLIGLLLMIPAFLLGGLGSLLSNGDTSALGCGAMVWVGLAGLVLLGANLYFLLQDGQTLGKKIVGTRIVDVSGARISGWKILGLRMIVPGVLGSIPILGIFFSLADVLFIFRDDRRCIHDHFCGTIVVKI
jgi:uncharacterized RDD family membrane protein YckC